MPVSSLTLASPAARTRAVTVIPVTIGLAGFVAASHLDASIQSAGSSLPLAAALAATALVVSLWGWRVAHQLTGRLLLGGAALFASLAAIWLCSRTVGLPFGIAPRAPAGILDSVTAFDEVLLAAAAVMLATTPGRAEGLLPGFAFLAMSVSFMLLIAGCGIGAATPQRGVGFAARSAVPLFCHLY
jgi:hypothetical protein